MRQFSEFTSFEKAKILFISDKPVTAKAWGYSLNQMGLDVTLISVEEDVLQAYESERPDMVIIEDMDELQEELELTRKLRAVSVVPILFLTARLNEAFQLEVYQVGADECIIFPVTPRLFQAKVNAWLRRMRTIPAMALDEICAGSFTLNIGRRLLVLPSGDFVHLTILETRLLYVLMSHPGSLMKTDDLTNRVWGCYGDGDGALLKNLVYRLRKKIELNSNQPRKLVSEGSSGYMFTT
jgi:two-component system, OmpR family, response regulator VicR